MKFSDKTSFDSEAMKGKRVAALGVLRVPEDWPEKDRRQDFGRLHSVVPNEDYTIFDLQGFGAVFVPAEDLTLIHGLN